MIKPITFGNLAFIPIFIGSVAIVDSRQFGDSRGLMPVCGYYRSAEYRAI